MRFATALSAASVAALYDGIGNPTWVEFANVKSWFSASASDRWSWNVYDKAGRLIQTVDPIGSVSKLEYDGAGRLLKTTRFYETMPSNIYEGYKTNAPTAVYTPAANYWDRVVKNFYDKDGLLRGTLDEENFLTEIKYDKAGRKVETFRYALAAPSAALDSNSNFTGVSTHAMDIHNYWIYDGRGLVGATIDGEGNITNFHYTAKGQVSKEIRGRKLTIDSFIGAGESNKSLAWLPNWYIGGQTEEITDFTYDALGQLTNQVRNLTGGTETTLFTYDSMGNKLTETVSETVSSETRTQSFRYDAKGRLIASIGGQGSAAMLAAYGANPTEAQKDIIFRTYGTRFVYDAADRLLQKLEADGSGNSGDSRRTVYYYDTDGQLRYEINALGEVMEYRYNTLEDRSDSFVFANRIAGGTLVGLTGGLVSAAILNAISGISGAFSTAVNTTQATYQGSAHDSRTQYTYGTRGELYVAYSPLYSAANGSDYSVNYYTNFGELYQTLRPTDNSIYHWNNSVSWNYQRGLKYWDYSYLNGSSTGAQQQVFQYDAFGRMNVEYTTYQTDGRNRQYAYDRSNRLTDQRDRFYALTKFGYDARSNLISQTDRTGRITSFAYDKFNRTVTTTTTEGVVSSVKKNAYGQTIQLTDGAGRSTSYTYDKNGNLKTVTDAAGTTTNNYDNADRLIETIDGRGHKTSFVYDAVGRMLTRTDALGGVTTYVYDAKGQQISVTDARGTITSFAYDLKGQKTRVIQDVGGLALTTDYVYRADGKVTSMTEGVGTNAARTIAYEYDTMGRLTAELVDPSGLNLITRHYYDGNNNVVATTDARGNTTRFVYDNENRLVFTVNADRGVTQLGYDAEGRNIWARSLANRMDQAAFDHWNAIQLFQLTAANVQGNSTLSGADRISRTMYDGDGRKAYQMDGEGYVSRFKYDGANNIIKTIVYANSITAGDSTLKSDMDAVFGSIDSPPASAAVTSFAYDAANRLTSTTDAEGFTESYQYDAVGNRTWVTNKLGGQAQFNYDALNRVVWKYVYAPTYNNEGANTAGGFYEFLNGYDAVGNVTSEFKGYGTADQIYTEYTYDRANRLTQRNDPAIYGQRAYTNFQYDARGNVTLQTNADGGKIYSFYDASNRKIAEISPVLTLSNWTYDANGNVKTERVWAGTTSFPGSPGGNPPIGGGAYRETEYNYDRNNRRTQSIVKNVRTGSYNGSSYVTNAAQDLTSSVEYDAFGNVSKETDANLNSAYHWYDRNGREVQKLDADGYVTTWTRDEDGNVTTERRYATQFTGSPSSVSVATSSADRVTNFVYDKNGRRTSEARTGVGSSRVGAGGALTAGISDSTINYSYNGLGQVTRKVEAYDSGVTNAVGYTTDYDNQGRLNWQRDPGLVDHNSATAYRLTWFRYDALGNVVRTIERAADAYFDFASGYSAVDDRITRYGYTAGKQAWVLDANSAYRYTHYDIMGRQTHDYYSRLKSDGTYDTSYNGNRTSYDAAGRVTAQWQADYATGDWTIRGPETRLIYNAYGEVLNRQVGNLINGSWVAATVETNEYDNAGRVVKTNSGDGVWKFMVYDANGNTTLTMTSTAAADLGAWSADFAASWMMGSAGASSNTLALASFNQTYTTAAVAVFDKRNMARASHEPGRQVAGSTQTISRSQTYNAFGEVASETDARGNTTNYTYNTMGRVTKKEAPTVSVTSESGAVSSIRPTENYVYDISGRLVGTQDANGWWTTRLLLAGTGHAANGDGALVVKEFRPDSSVWETRYDAFRDARVMIDGLNRATYQYYDKMHRVTQITRPATAAGSLVEYYAYDMLGQKIKSWNNYYGEAYAARTDYDIQGRVISQIAQGGDFTYISYAWDASIATTGLGTFGGWVETTTFTNYRTTISKTDAYGRETAKKDMGERYWHYVYDTAGRSVIGGQTSGWLTAAQAGNVATATSLISAYNRTTSTYLNTGQLASISGQSGTESYGYDANGNRISEYATGTYGQLIKNATATYDALNRLTEWTENGSATLPYAKTITSYDAVGNIRATEAHYSNLDAYGTATAFATPAAPTKYWYRYDALNRVVTDKGVFLNGTISRGVDAGRDIAYNLAGERAYVARTVMTSAGYGLMNYNETRELYTYSATGLLTAVSVADGAVVSGSYTGPPASIPSAVGPGTAKADFYYDLLGRVYLQQDYLAGISGASFSRSVTYNVKNQVVVDTTSTIRAKTSGSGYDTWYTITRNDYDDDGFFDTGYGYGYALGGVVWSASHNFKNGSDGDYKDTMTKTEYEWWEGAVQSKIKHDKSISMVGNGGTNYVASQNRILLTNFGADFTSTYTYNGLGQLTSVEVADGVAKTINYTNDGVGQIIRRDETRTGYYGQAAPHEAWYRFAGRTMGMVGNNGTVDVSYVQSVQDRAAAAVDVTSSNAGLFRNGTSTGNSSYADFSQSIDPYNSNSQGSGGGIYTVNTGDTLQSIAAQLWGDAGLWYKIAEANGLSAQANLIEGQTLMLPAGVTKSTHNASTFQPYNAAEAIGDTMPTTPKPPKKPKCGTFGMILLALIAVAVTVVTAGAAFAAAAPGLSLGQGITIALGGAAGGFSATTAGLVLVGAASAAAGSVVSQAVGVATGIQDKFSWKGVGLAALSGAIGGLTKGVDIAGKLGIGSKIAGSTFLGNVANGAVNNAFSQSLSVATGIQKKFSWKSVAAAGLSAGVSSAVDFGLAPLGANNSLNNHFAHFSESMAKSLASAATHSLVSGTDFGDNIISSLPDVVETTIGGIAEHGLSVPSKSGMRMAKAILSDRRGPARVALDSDIDNATVNQLVAEGELSSPNFKFRADGMEKDLGRFTPSGDGLSGTGTAMASLVDRARAGDEKAAALLWAVYQQEGGAFLDERGRALQKIGGDSKGDEGAAYALAKAASLLDHTSGSRSDKVAFSIEFDDIGVQSFKTTAGLISDAAIQPFRTGYATNENRVGRTEFYNSTGHFLTIHDIAYLAAREQTGDLTYAYNRAMTIAIGSQFPDMVHKYDAIAISGKEFLRIGTWPRGSKTPPGKDPRASELLFGLHFLAYGVKRSRIDVATERSKMLGDIKTLIYNGNDSEAGIVLHRYADSFTHLNSRGGVRRGLHGHAKANLSLGKEQDNIYYNREGYLDYYETAFVAISQGFGSTEAQAIQRAAKWRAETDRWLTDSERGSSVMQTENRGTWTISIWRSEEAYAKALNDLRVKRYNLAGQPGSSMTATEAAATTSSNKHSNSYTPHAENVVSRYGR